MATGIPCSCPRFVLPAALALFSAVLSSAVNAAQTLKMNGPLVQGGDVLDLELAGARLVYLADQDRNDEFELYTVPADASGSPRRLNSPRPVGANAPEDYRNSMKVSPDGAWVVYRADEHLPGVFELFSVPVDGSAAPAKLNAPLTGEQDVELEPRFQITPDSRYVLYCADQEEDQRVELFRVPIDGSGPPLVLNEPFAAGGSISGFVLSPDARRVAIQLNRGLARGHALFVAATDGSGAAVELTPNRSDLVILRSWTRFSPDGKRLVYGAYFASGYPERRVYSASVHGILPPALLSGRTPLDVTGFQITADSSRVVFLRKGQQNVLLSAPIDGSGTPIHLHAGAIAEDQWRLSSATGRVVFFEPSAFTLGDVISLPADGSPGAIVLASSVASRFLSLTPDGSSALFDDGNQVYGRAVDGSTPLRFLGLPPRATERVAFLGPSEHGGEVLYLSDHDLANQFELYVVPPDGSAPARKVNGDLVSSGDATSEPYTLKPAFELSPSGDRVFYIADQERDGVYELYARFLPRPHRGAR